jgi:hypothetical protein
VLAQRRGPGDRTHVVGRRGPPNRGRWGGAREARCQPLVNEDQGAEVGVLGAKGEVGLEAPMMVGYCRMAPLGEPAVGDVAKKHPGPITWRWSWSRGCRATTTSKRRDRT